MLSSQESEILESRSRIFTSDSATLVRAQLKNRSDPNNADVFLPSGYYSKHNHWGYRRSQVGPTGAMAPSTFLEHVVILYFERPYLKQSVLFA